MRMSVDKRLRKIFLSKGLDDFEHLEHENKKINTSLRYRKTKRLFNDKKDSFSYEETYNPSVKDYIDSKKEINKVLLSEKNIYEINEKRIPFKKARIEDDKNKSQNKKKIYVKKKRTFTIKKDNKKDEDDKINNNNDNKQIKGLEDSDYEQKEMIKQNKKK